MLKMENNLLNPMKLHVSLVMALLLGLVVAGGCKKKPADAGVVGPNTIALENSFEKADEAIGAIVFQVNMGVRYGDYPKALAELQKLEAQSGLKPEQQQAIKDLVARIQQEMANKPAAAPPQ
jgi:hypothetical protein